MKDYIKKECVAGRNERKEWEAKYLRKMCDIDSQELFLEEFKRVFERYEEIYDVVRQKMEAVKGNSNELKEVGWKFRNITTPKEPVSGPAKAQSNSQLDDILSGIWAKNDLHPL